MSHLSPDLAARWVAGLLEAPEAEAVEAHARACPACEALLQREARAELALARAVAAPPPLAVPRPRRPRRWALVAAPVALAAAALLVLLLRPGDGAGGGPGWGDAGAVEVVDRTHFPGEAPPPEAFQARAPFAL